MSKERRPRIFVASSTEDLDVARAIESNLHLSCEMTTWERQVFAPSHIAIVSLEKMLESQDAAIVVLGHQDVAMVRGKEHRAPRDNVLLELGMFIGKIGRDRTFVIVPSEESPKIPSDLAGLNRLEFDSDRSDGNLQAALGPATNEILDLLRRDPSILRSRSKSIYFAAPHRNIESNQSIKGMLEAVGVHVSLPYDLLERRTKAGENLTPEKVRSTCIEAINSSDCVVVDVSSYGSDTAWEIGYADALDKQVLGVAHDGSGISRPRTFQRKYYGQNFMHTWDKRPIYGDLAELRDALKARRVHVCGPFNNETAIDELRGADLERDLRSLI